MVGAQAVHQEDEDPARRADARGRAGREPRDESGDEGGGEESERASQVVFGGAAERVAAIRGAYRTIDCPDRMSRPARLVFLSLALCLVLFPATVAKPGQPMGLKSDEPAYYLMSLSLLHDRDLRCGVEDIRRLAIEFPNNLVNNLILMSGDGWRTTYFGKPWVASLLAVPGVALAGSDGFVATNMALLLLSVWLGALYLRRHNPEWLALLFSAGFFLLSNAFAYVFWMHTEVLCVAGVTACLYLAFTPAPEGPARSRIGRAWARVWNDATRPAFSCAALAVAAYNKPQLALLGLAPLVALYRRRGTRAAATWLGGGAIAGLALCGLSLALTPTASAYLGVERQGVRVESFDRMPELPEPAPVHEMAGERNSWQWIFRPPDVDSRLPPNLVYFLVGRHTGLFLYAPFTLLCLALFLRYERRSGVRWLLVAGLAGVAFFALLWIPFNWHGGGGFVGNRYFVNALPGFLFLVTRIAPAPLALAGYALGGLFVGPIVFSPYGAIVPSPTLQAHTRNAPFQLFPFEETLRGQIPGYRGYVGGGGSYLYGRSDLFRPVGDALWVAGGRPVRLSLRTLESLRRPVFQVETITAPNRVRLELGGSSRETNFQSLEPGANATRVVLAPAETRLERDFEGAEFRDYELTVDAASQAWHYEVVPTRNRRAQREAEPTAGATPSTPDDAAQGRAVPDWEETELEMLVGAIVTYLGEEDELAADVYAVEWLAAPDPGRLPPGRTALFPGRVRNASGAVWRAKGGTRVALAYHWLRPDGTRVQWDGLRTLLKDDLAPGEAADVEFEIETPRAPGSYLLEFDAVREQIAWFSDRGAATVRRTVEIAP